MVNTTPAQIANMTMLDAHAGRVIIFRHDIAPGMVLEYVPDAANITSVTALYNEHPIFASRQSLRDARLDLIGAIDSHLMSIPNTAQVKDEGREALYILPEFGTAQLYDLFAQFTGSDRNAA